MFLYIELWKAKPSWTGLSAEQRKEYMDKVGPAIGELLASGVECLAWGRNDSGVAHRGDYDYYAIWKMASPDQVHGFEQAVEAAGWYHYMDQVNVSGEMQTPDQVIAHHIGLAQT